MNLLLALIGHLVGDYILQNDWMAGNKKGDLLPPYRDVEKDENCREYYDNEFLPKLQKWCAGSLACLTHCLIWTACVCLFAGWGWQCAIPLFLTHYIQDRSNLIKWWMTARKGGWGQAKFVEFGGIWAMIVVDNVFHVLQIWAVWKFIAAQ